MASSFSSRARLELQEKGENNETWGKPKLNNALSQIEDMAKGVESFALSGSKTLTSLNASTDEARNTVLWVTGGTGGDITIPSVEWQYLVVNGASGAVTITNGSSSDSVQPGEAAWVYTDSVTVEKAVLTEFGGKTLTNLGAPSSNADAATKKYVDDTAFNAVDLPAQTGNAGKFLQTNGTSASWQEATFPFTLTSGDITAVEGNHYGADSDVAARAVTLPPGPADGAEVRISDAQGNAITNNVTLNRNGKTIGQVAENFVIDLNNGFVWLRYDSASDDWLIIGRG